MSRRIATLGSMKRETRSRSGSRSGDDADRQEFYVGGGERSGQAVIGPSNAQASSDDRITRLFENARAHGAEVLSQEDNARHGSQNAMQFASETVGYRLGDAIQPSEAITLSTTAPLLQDVVLVMYDNGFTVDGGAVRSLNDPANQEFLSAVTEGRIPSELIKKYPGMVINLRMERRHEAPVSVRKSFGGQGQRLGEIVPPVLGAGVVGQKANEHCSVNVLKESLNQAQGEVKLLDGEQVYQVQVRVPNGSRIVGRFNSNHTVQDVRTFVVTAIPDYAFQPFSLMTTFPNRLIEDEAVSIKDAGLLNAVIVAKLV